MAKRYLALDLETARVSDGSGDWRSQRPLGITCVALLGSDQDSPQLWHGKNSDGTPAPQMTPAEIGALLTHLRQMIDSGYTLLTWNGMGFDWDILAEESGDLISCRNFALGHIDMMFHIFCEKGFAVSLDKAAQGLGLLGKLPGMTGSLAPQLWAEGRHAEVLAYVAQDVRTAIGIATESERHASFSWITSRGRRSSMPLSAGWLNVQAAQRLPLPDTTWMDDPWPREKFTDWLASPSARN
jgi:RNase_H superfamily